MKTFSQVKSHDGKFDLKLEYSDGEKPSKLLIEVVAPKSEPVTVSDLARAIYDAYTEYRPGEEPFLHWTLKNFPCEIKDGFECREIEISWDNRFERILHNIASQISI